MFKKLFGKQELDAPGLKWVEAADNPWGVRVLDLRPGCGLSAPPVPGDAGVAPTSASCRFVRWRSPPFRGSSGQARGRAGSRFVRLSTADFQPLTQCWTIITYLD